MIAVPVEAREAARDAVVDDLNRRGLVDMRVAAHRLYEAYLRGAL
jgi:hypothetical protein